MTNGSEATKRLGTTGNHGTWVFFLASMEQQGVVDLYHKDAD
jgi:hypothetical protein